MESDKTVSRGKGSESNIICLKRIQKERREWKKDHPKGFYAQPYNYNGRSIPTLWVCGIPGPEDSIWASATFIVALHFPPSYPSRPPRAMFYVPGETSTTLYHPNIYPSGTVCLSLLNDRLGWVPTVSVKAILLAIQHLIGNPNLASPAQEESLSDLKADPKLYLAKAERVVNANKTETFTERLKVALESPDFLEKLGFK